MALVPYEKRLKAKAQELRKSMTKEERKLWYEFLRNFPVRFIRQKPLGRYIADFYSPTAQVVIELDGGQHYETDTQHYDAERTAYMEAQGLCVLRYSNLEILQNFGGVCEDISRRVMKA